MQFLKQNVFNKKIVKTQTFDWFQRFFLCRGTRIRTWDLLLPKENYNRIKPLINK